jgi:hypothetical protein
MAAHSVQFEVRAVASDDLDLVHASKNGDVAAFEQLVKKYDRKLLRIAQSVSITEKIRKTRFRKPS